MPESSSDFHIQPECKEDLHKIGIDSLESVFSFSQGQSLHKPNLTTYRERIVFTCPESGRRYYLKRFVGVPVTVQLKNWLTHRQIASMGRFEQGPVKILQQAGIQTPRVAAFGQEWGKLLEKRSFCITCEVKGKALERRLPEYFKMDTPEAICQRRDFIQRLAEWVRKFHNTGCRHRDLYLCHIFYTDCDDLVLIDLQRIFRPLLCKERYRIKDLAQLYYSAPSDAFTCTDRLRFLLAYSGSRKVTGKMKKMIRSINQKARRMRRHDRKHGRPEGFAIERRLP